MTTVTAINFQVPNPQHRMCFNRSFQERESIVCEGAL